MANKIGKTGVLLVNLGTPDSYQTKDVRKYLRQFLMDWRVVDFPFISRWMLVNLIIAPFRAPKSAKAYKELWEERGSPLKYYGDDVKAQLQETLGNNYYVELGMRYQNPSIEHALEQLQKAMVNEIVCIPLFPQYASATNGSVIDEVMRITRSWQVIPELSFVNKFFDHPLFIEAFVDNAKKIMEKENFDHVLFSYHGIPVSQIQKASFDGYCKVGDCCMAYHKKNQYCYRAQCYATSRLIAQHLNLDNNEYTVTFQSRLGPTEWIKPYTDKKTEELAKDGVKKLLVFSPAFVADCLETTMEIGEELKETFQEAGGEDLVLVPSLNANEKWVEALKDLVIKNQSHYYQGKATENELFT